ncbi:MAG: aminoacetone oxidase family FAD-binding enzyme [Planctomycetota bacterium]|nr:aminoacetone oxidase family FAD-binding enzyme [Planctomycetota bacterium]MDA1105064.1 aminoacetone oxidase family FAD-binding enzyme [Planctomycetota bacterium]
MACEGIDIAVVGAGAAGLMAAITAGRACPGRSIVAFDGARTIGAKILVAGGGRCNVTHHQVTERDFAGGSPNAIRQVLRSFAVEDTVRFFGELGVELKREETGKLFPVTDSARTVLNALLGAAKDAGVQIRHPCRVLGIARADGQEGFELTTDAGTVSATRVIVATGGKALPKSGSDGAGYDFVTGLGHTLREPIIPSLAPLVVNDPAWIRELSGVATRATITLVSSTGKHLKVIEHDLLCTHFGLSGPGAMDMSRHWHMARLDDRGAHLIIDWRAGWRLEDCEASLRRARAPALAWLRQHLPERLARALLDAARVDPEASLRQLTRESMRALTTLVTQCPVHPTETRGFTYAEATAGGVPLDEIRLQTMESRPCPGLHLCGEILDVDGRIGGFNFQWAWATGFLAGRASAGALPPAG